MESRAPEDPRAGLAIPLWIIAGFMAMAAMYLARIVRVPPGVALLLARILQPVVRRPRRGFGMGASPAAAICLGFVLLLHIIGSTWSMVGINALRRQAADIGV